MILKLAQIAILLQEYLTETGFRFLVALTAIRRGIQEVLHNSLILVARIRLLGWVAILVLRITLSTGDIFAHWAVLLGWLAGRWQLWDNLGGLIRVVTGHHLGVLVGVSANCSGHWGPSSGLGVSVGTGDTGTKVGRHGHSGAIILLLILLLECMNLYIKVLFSDSLALHGTLECLRSESALLLILQIVHGIRINVTPLSPGVVLGVVVDCFISFLS